MSRKRLGGPVPEGKRKRTAFVVETRKPLDRWAAAGIVLSRIDPATFAQMLALSEGYVSLHAPQLEAVEEFRSRLAMAYGRRDHGSN